MIALPSECILGIFKHLSHKCLFSCLLVNRQWCRYVVPLLWSTIYDVFRNEKIIRTCLLLLNTEEQALLIPFNIILPNGPKPLFEYTKHILYLHFCVNISINGVINLLYERERYSSRIDKMDVARAIKRSLISMFLRTGDKIKSVEFESGWHNVVKLHRYPPEVYEDTRKVIMNSLSENLYKCTSLKSLSVNVALFPEDVNTLAKALCKNSTLTSLRVVNNNFSYEIVKPLTLALYENTTLTCLDFMNSHLDFKGDLKGCKALADVLYKNTTLTSLNIQGNQLGPEGVKVLAEALFKNTSLTSLNIRSNHIGFEGAKALADVLRKNDTLTSLDVGNNWLGPEGGIMLAMALLNNTSLVSLDITGNQIGCKGGKALSDVLCKNTTLTSLNIYNNHIGYEGKEALAEALLKNTTLIYLEIGHNF